LEKGKEKTEKNEQENSGRKLAPKEEIDKKEKKRPEGIDKMGDNKREERKTKEKGGAEIRLCEKVF